jgi:hypothetical protein
VSLVVCEVRMVGDRCLRTCPEWLRKITRNFRQDNRCPGRYSSGTSPEHKPTALPLDNLFGQTHNEQNLFSYHTEELELWKVKPQMLSNSVFAYVMYLHLMTFGVAPCGQTVIISRAFATVHLPTFY